MLNHVADIRFVLRGIGLFLLIALLPFALHAANLSHSGSITVNTTWLNTDQHTVTGDVTVEAGVTLTIDPGTTVSFQALNDDQGGGFETSRPELIVEGTLVADGTVGSPIVLTSNALVPAAGDWGGIHQSGGGDLTLRHVTLSYATVGVAYTADGGVIATTVVENSTIEQMTGNGLWFELTNNAVLTLGVSNNTLGDIGGTGIFAASRSGSTLTATIASNQLQTIGSYGVYGYVQDATSTLDVAVTGNGIDGTGNDGIYLYSNNQSNWFTVLVDNNTVSNATGSGSDGIYVYQADTATVTNNAMTAVGGYGLYLRLEGYDAVARDATVTGNTVTSAGSYGLFVNPYYTTGTYDVSGNTVTGAQGYGIQVSKNNGALTGLTVDGNTASGVVYGTGIYVGLSSHNQGPVSLSDNVVHGNEYTGLTLQRTGSGSASEAPVVRNNQAYNNGSRGTYPGLQVNWTTDAGNQVPALSLNTVYGNTGAGLLLSTGDGVDVVFNDIYSNGTDGISVSAGGVARVHENNLVGNTGYDLRNAGAVAVSADSNWWGSVVTAEMAGSANPKDISVIFDIYDDGTKGTASYVPWLGAAQVLAPGAVSWVRLPDDGAALKGPNVLIEGSASAAAGIDYVEVSTDNGVSWAVADGTENWRYAVTGLADGVYQLRSRVVTLDAVLESPGVGNTLTINSSLPTTSGTLTVNETWTGTVSITGDITVPAGVTLTIDPGTTVSFQALNDDQGGGFETSRPELIVEGTLVADGTVGSPIVLTSNALVPAAGDWGGIHQSGGGDLTLRHVTLSYATVGVAYTADGGVIATTVVENSTIEQMTGNGLWFELTNNAVLTLGVSNNTLGDIGGTGIFAASRSGSTLTATIASNQLQTIGSYGVYGYVQDATSTLDVAVTGNGIDGTGNDGIYLYSNNQSNWFTVLVDNNTVSNATGSGSDGIYVYQADTATVTNNAMTAVGGYGLYLRLEGYDAVARDATVTGNTVTSAGSYGLFVNPYYTTGTYDVSGNTVTGAQGYGIQVSKNNGALTGLTVDGNTASGVVYGTGIYVGLSSHNQGPVSLSDNVVHGNEYTGLTLQRTGSGSASEAPVVRNNQAYNNGSRGTYPGLQVNWTTDAGNQVPALSLNTVYGNTGAGLLLSTGDGVDVVFNDIYSNGTDGISVSAGGVARVHENNLVGNTGYDLRNAGAVAVSADSNWWGSVVTAEMAGSANPKDISVIFDIYDDGTKGTASYVPWLGAAQVLAPGAVSWVRLPDDGAALKGPNVLIEGSASAAAGIDYVEVSTDNGVSWAVADGTENWRYAVTGLADGVYQLRSRVVTLDAVLESPGVGNTLTINSSLPTTSGTLTVNETWTGTVSITGDITVPAGVTLTIDPGTTVSFQALNDDQGGGFETSRPELIVEGTLVADGTVGSPIVLTSNALVPAAGDWGGIHQSGGGDLTLRHVTLSYATVGVAYTADGGVIATTVVENSTIEQMTGNGLWFELTNNAVLTLGVSNNTLGDIGGTGIFAASRSGSTLTATIASNQLQTIGSYGVYGYVQDATSTLDVAVTGNGIDGTGNDGIYLYSNNQSNWFTVLVDNNTVSNATGSGSDGIYVYQADTATVTNNAMTAVGGYGLYLRLEGYDAVARDATVTGNTVTSAGSYGLFVNPYYTTGTYDVSGNTVTGAQGYGIQVSKNNGALTGLTVDGNTASGVVYGTGIYVGLSSHNQGPVSLSDNVVHGNEYTGLTLQRTGSGSASEAPVVRNNQAYNNGSRGTYPGLQVNWTTDAGNQVPALSLNTVYGNTGAGLLLSTGDGVDVVFNDIYSNGTDGISVSAGGVARVHENNLVGNTGYDLRNAGAVAVSADSNWWGSVVTAEMAGSANPKDISVIFDIYDDGTKGTASYVPWLGAAQVLAPGAVSWVRLPDDGAALKGPNVLIEGSASAAAGIDYVEVSTDNGVSWAVADGTENWRYAVTGLADGVYQLRSRVVTLDAVLESPGVGNTLTINSSLPTTSGTLTVNETWTGTVSITGDITVPAGVTLTIDPGTTVEFQALNDDQGGGFETSRPELIVEGTLVADGTVGSPIVLTSNALVPAAGDWGGIHQSGGGDLTLRHVTLSYATVGVAYTADGGVIATTVVENSTIEQMTGNGLWFELTNNAVLTLGVSNNTLGDIGGTGIFAASRSGSTLTATIASNQLQTIGSYGVYGYVQDATSTLDVAVTGNGIDGTGNDGIYLYSNNQSNWFTVLVDNNTVSNATGSGSDGIYVYQADTATVTNNAMTAVGGYGLYLRLEGYDAVARDATVTGNTVTSAGSYGLFVNPYYTTGTYDVSGNTVTGAQGYGIQVSKNNGALTGLTVDGNTASGVVYGTGIYVGLSSHNQGPVSLSDNVVHGNEYTGLTLQRTGSGSASEAPVVRNNQAYNNGSRGTYPGLQVNWTTDAGNQVPALSLNTVYGNTGAGLLLSTGDGVDVVFNDIYSNGTDGISVSAGGVARVHENNLVGNTGYDLRNAGAVAVSADSNWWGSVVTAEMAGSANPKDISVIFDIYDDGTKGTASYVPWLGAAQVLAPGAVSWVRLPDDGAALKGPNVLIEGSASAAAGIDYVEVSTDNGVSWAVADGTENWRYAVTGLADGVYQLRSRVVTLDAVLESPGVGNTLTIDSALPIVTSGTVLSDTTWSGNVTVSGDITVPAGVTLTIEAGTAVTVPGRGDDTFGGMDSSLTEIRVDGNLLIQGTTIDPVVIAPVQAPLIPGDWAGLTVNGILDMSYTTVAYAETGVRCTADAIMGSCSISNSLIRDSALNGAEVESLNDGQLTANLNGNEITDNAGAGLYAVTRNGNASSIDLMADANTITTNAGGGVYLYANGATGDPQLTATISNSNISDNSSLGVFVDTRNGAVSDVAINDNLIDSNVNADGVYFDNYYAGVTSAHSIIGNQVSNNRFMGLRYYNQYSPLSPVIQANDIHLNLSAGMHLTVGNGDNLLAAPITGNTITGNDTGLFVEATAAITVSNNEIHDNGVHDLYNDGLYAINAQQNWWGVTTTNDLNSGGHPRNIAVIFDAYDDASKGEVDYSNWLSSFQQPLAPVVDPVTTPVTLGTQPLTGTKPANTGIEINGATVVPVDALTTWTVVVNLAESLNSFTVKSVDAVGLVSDGVDVFIVRDTTPPRILSSSPANGTITSQFIDTLQLTLYDVATEVDMALSAAGASVELGGVAVVGTWSIDSNRLIFTADSILSPGAYVVTVDTVDTPLGNSGIQTVSFAVDTVPPVAVTLLPVVSPTNGTPQQLSGTKEAGTAVWINGFQAVPEDGLTSWQYNYPLQSGANAISIIAVDGAGNTSAAIDTSITYDAVAPTVLSVDPAAGSYAATRPGAVTLALQDNVSGIDESATVAGASLTGNGGPVAGVWSLEPGDNLVFVPAATLAEDAYTVNATITDLATNVAPFQSTFTYDATAPPVPVVDPVSSPTSNANQTLTGSKESGTGILVNAIEVIPPNAATSWTHDVILTNGSNTLNISAQDLAGNESASVAVEIIYDDIAPLPVNNLTVDGNGPGDTAALDWSGYDEGVHGDVAGYQVFIETSLFTQVDALSPVIVLPAGTFSYTATSLVEGTPYYFAVVPLDTNGNRNTSVTPVMAVPTDTEAPEDPENITVTSYADRLVLEWTASANSAGDLDGYQLYINAVGPTLVGAATTQYEFIGLSASTSYALRVAAVDDNANESMGVTINGVTLLPNPTGLTVDPLSGKVGLAWNPVVPAGLVKEFTIYAETTPYTNVSGLSPALVVGPTVTDRQLAGLTNGTTYYFAATTINLSGGETKDVTAVSATPVPDTDGPVLGNITFEGAPLADGATITGNGLLGATASDESGMSRVEFLVDGTAIGIDTNGADDYATLLDVIPLTDGPHALAITAYDSLANTTTINLTINVALAPPVAPVIVDPVTGITTNQVGISVSGTAEVGADVFLYKDSVQVSGPFVVAANGNFSGSMTLAEGANQIQAAAQNRGGTGPLSSIVTVTLDSSVPDAPTGLIAQSLEAGEILITWSKPNDDSIDGYDLYRSGTTFDSIGAATRVNSSILAGTSYTDLPPAEGTWYYRVLALNDVGTPSLLSNESAAESDSTPPRAMIIEYTPGGAYDAASGRIGVGQVDVHVTVNEPLLTTPFLSLAVSGGIPINVQLSPVSDTEYDGFFDVTASTKTGTAYAAFSARDEVGNRGTAIDQGASVLFDTSGPVVTAISILPAAPVRNEELNPVPVQVNIELDAALPVAEVPALSYLLSGAGRTETAIPALSEVDPLHWTGSFTLPPDAGLAEAENLQFIFSAVDDLGNSGNEIQGVNSFQVYQGNLPPLDVPSGLVGVALPGGQAQLNWDAVEGAASYQVYRQASGEPGLTEYLRVGANSFIDTPGVDGLYRYAVASVREANADEALSAQSPAVDVTTDSAAPGAPTGLILSLQGSGVVADWSAPVGETDISYSLYRSSADILSVAGLTPVLPDLAELTAIDGAPSESEAYYAVTAVDLAGNESTPSTSAYINVDLLPVANLRVTQTDDQAPLLSWTQAGTNVAGFNVYVDESGQRYTLTQSPIVQESYADTGYVGQARHYVVTTVDGNSVESVERNVLLPAVSASLIGDALLYRGIMNRLDFEVTNNSVDTVSGLVMRVNIDGREHASPPFDLAGAGSDTVSVIVGGYADLPAAATLETIVDLTRDTGEQSQLIRNIPATVGDGALTLSLETVELTRGATGTVRFTLHNTTEVELDIVTAQGAGNSPSDQIRVALLDEDENTLSVTPFFQSIGAQLITLANGTTVARIPAGESFTSDDITISIPSSAPDDVIVELGIDQIHYRLGSPESASISGLDTLHGATLSDVPYGCSVGSVTPSVAFGAQDVVITGTATDTATGLPLASVPLNLVIETRGFERLYNVYTDIAGDFSYTFNPGSTELGVYRVSCIHPDLSDRPAQETFAFQGVALAPVNATLQAYIDATTVIPYEVTAGEGTSLTGVRLEYLEANQPGGAFPDGITVDVGTPIALGSGESGTLPVSITATDVAPATGQLILHLKTNETVGDVVEVATIDYQFNLPPGDPRPPLAGANPLLRLDNNLVETGVDRDDTITETIILENIGTGTVESVKVALVNTDDTVITNDWAFLTSPGDEGTITVGGQRNIQATFAPDATVTEGTYQYKLRVTSANYPTQEALFVVSVTQSGIGGALFRLSDIYTATLDENDDVIPGLADAKILMQNERVPTIEATLVTDAFGEALFTNLASGWYKFRASAPNHQEVIGRVRIKPDVTISQDVFLDYNLVTVEWSVTEITIEDRYEITLSLTFETDVPAPVVVIEPPSITLPEMQPGDVFNGELTLTNYGLVRADNVTFPLEGSDQYFRYEALVEVPESLEAKQRVTIPYRVVSLAALDPSQTSGTGGGTCYSYQYCRAERHDYECANGTRTDGSSTACWTRAYGDCGNPGEGAGGFDGSVGGGGGGWGGFGGGGGGGSGSGSGSGYGGYGWAPTWSPPSLPIGGPFCPNDCDGDCCKAAGDGNGGGGGGGF